MGRPFPPSPRTSIRWTMKALAHSLQMARQCFTPNVASGTVKVWAPLFLHLNAQEVIGANQNKSFFSKIAPSPSLTPHSLRTDSISISSLTAPMAMEVKIYGDAKRKWGTNGTCPKISARKSIHLAMRCSLLSPLPVLFLFLQRTSGTGRSGYLPSHKQLLRR